MNYAELFSKENLSSLLYLFIYFFHPNFYQFGLMDMSFIGLQFSSVSFVQPAPGLAMGDLFQVGCWVSHPPYLFICFEHFLTLDP